MKSTLFEYDKLNRLIYMLVQNTNIEYNYIYNNCNRTLIIRDEKNRSNFKTTIEQKKIDNYYKNVKMFSEGEVYDTETLYNDKEQIVLIKRINKIKNTCYKKETVRNKFGDEVFWVDDYEGEVNIGFKVDLKKIIK